ncbi:hypothetical protein F0562_030852 [Nyssa sinensis]|uniref:Clp R domain-containing protein n=1 Tax=Nyssa sinensis TaxID=561372 RepID=A0A5J5AZW1_9ASTE|nr:hypothetical protein F0562_030852 [Nyssa sinensis]
MRAGACTLQQTLTTEAASVLKHSLSLARRRGHAQVTPLHVAATLLSSRASLLRRACLKSQPHQTSHPLQCRALELCFNVALNRLPTTPGPLLHGQPTLSNALIAALKRAQAHQRRGCIEQQQQQPLLAIKVELDQLILSILDDPSVSRVMREAGFSSTAVKNNLEDSSASSVFQCYSSSGGVYSSPCSPSPTETPREVINPTNFWHTHFLTYNSEPSPLIFSPQKKLSSNQTITDSASVKEDIKLVLEVLLRKKRSNTVIVGDSVSTTEGLVAELMGRVDRKEVPEELKSAHFIRFQFTSVPLRFMKREEVELNLSDLKRKVDSLASGGGVIIYTGDLKWTIDAAVDDRDQGGSSNGEAYCYSPVDHLVAEIGRLLSDYSSSSTKVWLMATANYQTYMKCQMREPPLEIQWGLQAISVPSGGLGLSLHGTSVHDSRITLSQNPSQILEAKPFSSKEEQDKLTCCAECTSNYEKEAKLFKSGQLKPPSLYLSSCNTKDLDKGSTQLPYWLQSHSTEARQKDDMVELRRKWNRLCQSHHQGRHTQNQLNSSLFNNQSLIGKTYSSYPWWPNQSGIFPDSRSISFADSTLKPNHNNSSLPRFRRQQSCHIEFSFSNGKHEHQPTEPNLDSLKNTEGKEVKITLALGNSLFSDTGKLAEKKSERAFQHGELCMLLKENVPWQSEIIPSIVEALMESKSIKKEKWLLIEGNDSIGKRRLARAIAESVFGSADMLFYMNMRTRDSRMSPCSESLERALRNHERLVVLVEDVDFADTQFKKFLANGFETGTFGEIRKKEGISDQTIFILTNSDSEMYEDDKKIQNSVIQLKLQVNENIPNMSTPNCDHKRKAEWDLSNKAKSPRIDDKDDSSDENGNIKKEFTRQLSSSTLDLNIRADEDDESGGKPGEYSPISSDLTLETSNDLQNPLGFLELIKNRFIFNRYLDRDSQMREMILSGIRGCFEEVYGREKMGCCTVEEMVLEEVCVGAGCFVNSLFENWLEDVLQRSLQTVKIGGKENMSVRLCFGGKGESGLGDGFMGSNLPRKIQLSFID